MPLENISLNELTPYDGIPLNHKAQKGVAFTYEKDAQFFSKFNVERDWTIEELGEMCNKMSPTLNGKYVVENDTVFDYNGEKFYRTNHNSTHGVRSAIYLEKLFEYEKYFKSVELTPQERNALRLGAILYRTGRVDESGIKIDKDKRQRCGEIFMKYASQFANNTKWKDAINMVNAVIAKPYGTPFNAGKEKYVGNLLNIAHEMDLWRLWNPKLSEQLKPILKNEGNGKKIGLELDQIAKNVISATGMDTKISRFNSKRYKPEFFEQTKDSSKCFRACNNAMHKTSFDIATNKIQNKEETYDNQIDKVDILSIALASDGKLGNIVFDVENLKQNPNSELSKHKDEINKFIKEQSAAYKSFKRS
jgi:hypothetical protein